MFVKNETSVDVATYIDENEKDFYFKHGWKEVSYEDILLFEYRMIRTDFFLKNLVEMSQEERIEVLEETEEDFDLVGPSYCFGEIDGFDNNHDIEMLFEIYGISCAENMVIKPDVDECFFSPKWDGNVIGEYELEQLGEKYIVPMVVICTGEQYVEGFDFKHIRKD